MDDRETSFLAGGGEMGARIRGFDWARTSLGSPDGWPQSLKTSVRLLLSSGHPMFIWWGPELLQFYNDAYAPLIGLPIGFLLIIVLLVLGARRRGREAANAKVKG